jgi:hypothetical protein
MRAPPEPREVGNQATLPRLCGGVETMGPL